MDRYWARCHGSSRDPLACYLNARLQTGDESVRSFDELVALAPDFAWGHLGLARAHLRKNGSEGHAEIQRSLDAALSICPSLVVPVLSLSGTSPDPEFWGPRLPALRTALGAASEIDRLKGYPRLWKLEFEFRAALDHEGVRRQLADDLERIRGLDRREIYGWWSTLAAGYDLGGDPALVAWARSGLSSRFPCTFMGSQNLYQRWMAPPFPDLPDEEIRVRLREGRSVLAQCPDDWTLNRAVFGLVAELDDLTASEIREAAQNYLRIWELHRDDIGTAKSPYFQVARLLLDHDLDLTEAASLGQKEAAYLKALDESHPIDNWPESIRPRLRQYQLARDAELASLRAEIQLKRGEVSTARERLAELHQGVVRLADAPEAIRHPIQAMEYEREGELALLEGRSLDAMAFLLAAERTNPALPVVSTELWAKLGGTAEGLRALMAGSVSEDGGISNWSTVQESLPPFELTDLEGRIWKAEELAGRTLVLNLWATWCAPCRLELPLVQELAEKLEDHSDVVVLTLNVDQSVGLVGPFVKKAGFQLPVLLDAESYLRAKDDGVTAIPQTWIVDAKGVIRREQTGFELHDREHWVSDGYAHVMQVAEESSSDD